jgi:hypothetical protein
MWKKRWSISSETQPKRLLFQILIKQRFSHKVPRTGKGHNYENQNVEKQPKRTSKISVFLVHHYYENQNVKKNEKNIESLIFV